MNGNRRFAVILINSESVEIEASHFTWDAPPGFLSFHRDCRWQIAFNVDQVLAISDMDVMGVPSCKPEK